MGGFVLQGCPAMLLAEAGDERLDIAGLPIEQPRRR
jgi:hypothetical protein